MANDHPLMQPLHSDSLRPRPVSAPAPHGISPVSKTSAVYAADAPDDLDALIASVMGENEAHVPSSPENMPAKDVIASLLAHENDEDEPEPAAPAVFDFDAEPEEEEEAFSPIAAVPFEEPEEPEKNGKREKKPKKNRGDAVPDHMIPTPVCVPLEPSAPPAPPRKHGWIRFVLLLPALAAAVLGAWYLGYRFMNLL